MPREQVEIINRRLELGHCLTILVLHGQREEQT